MALEKSYSKNDTSDVYSISASIGISVYPHDGETFEELYKMADKALYQSKAKGKNCYTRYNSENSARLKKLIPNINHNKRRKNDIVDYDIVVQVFNILYESENLKTSLNNAIKCVGEYYNVERCYIYETINSNDIYKNKYQWLNNERENIIDGVEYINNDILTNIFDLSNDDGVFYTNNVDSIEDKLAVKLLKDDNVKSIFLIEAKKDMEEKTFFGMDDCKAKRTWTEKEIRTLFHVGRIIFAMLDAHNKSMKMYTEINTLRSKLGNK